MSSWSKVAQGRVPQAIPCLPAALLAGARRPGQPREWRFQLQGAETGEKRGFVDLKAVADFLREESDPTDDVERG